MAIPIADYVKAVYDMLLHPVNTQGYHPSMTRCRYSNEILQYYKVHPTGDDAIHSALDFLKHYGYAVLIPERFIEDYDWRKLSSAQDAEGYPYVTLNSGKRLFMPGRLSLKQAKIQVNHLLTEQDKRSPHRYLTDMFNVTAEDVIADVGSAEGCLSLEVVDRVKHVYLFEAEPEWTEPLKRTFAPWKDKVTVVRKFVTDRDGSDCIRLDSFFKSEGVTPTFVKMDVEGAEMAVLRGMQALLDAGAPMKIAACTYHLPEAHQEISAMLQSRGFTCETSRGVMFSRIGGVRPPYFRKGLIRAERK